MRGSILVAWEFNNLIAIIREMYKILYLIQSKEISHLKYSITDKNPKCYL